MMGLSLRYLIRGLSAAVEVAVMTSIDTNPGQEAKGEILREIQR